MAPVRRRRAAAAGGRDGLSPRRPHQGRPACGRRPFRHRLFGRKPPGRRGVPGVREDPPRVGRRPDASDLHRRRQHGHRRDAAPGHRTGRRGRHHPADLPAVLRSRDRGVGPGRRGADARRHRRGLGARPRRHRRGVRRGRTGDGALQPAQPDRPGAGRLAARRPRRHRRASRRHDRLGRGARPARAARSRLRRSSRSPTRLASTASP